MRTIIEIIIMLLLISILSNVVVIREAITDRRPKSVITMCIESVDILLDGIEDFKETR